MEEVSLLQDFAMILVIAGIVGWVFRKLNLSAVVGFLLAGVIMGPHTPPFALVTDLERIQTLSELGLVFLMFYVGLNLSLARIKRMGFTVVLATAVTAGVVFYLANALAWVLGWDGTTALIFAAMLMVSSSAIITKLLAESGLSHERFAQNAQGVTVLEDVVAVVMLTLIGSQLKLGSGEDGGGGVGQTLLLLMGFVVLVMVVGLLVVPGLLRRLGKSSDADLSAILLAGLAFAAGWAAMEAGFSVALGAFLFGVVVAETSFKVRIEKRLAGAQDMFSAMFFVSIGMLIDTQAFVDNLGLILGVSASALMARTLAGMLGFLATGNDLRLAAMSGMAVTPIGEFSYIIAQTGVAAGAVPESFYAMAVGVSIVTAVLAPVLARRAEGIGNWVERRQPGVVARGLAGYGAWLERAGAVIARNHVWRLTRRQVMAVVLEVLLLAGVLGFSPRIRAGLAGILERTGYVVPGWELAYAAAVGLVALLLLVSLWRTLSALSMIYAEVLTARAEQVAVLRPVVQGVMQFGCTVGLMMLVWVLLPVRVWTPWIAVAVIAVVGVFGFVLRRRLIRWHSFFEASLSGAMESDAVSRMGQLASGSSHAWEMHVAEAVLPEEAACAGRTIRELELRSRLGCAVVEVERQGVLVANPRADFQLFPGDRMLLFGSEEALGRARELLEAEGAGDADGVESDFAESVLEDVMVGDSGRVGIPLAELRIPERTGVQVMGIERDGKRLLNPDGKAVLQTGDHLLVMGSAAEIRVFRGWMEGGVC